MEKYIKEIILIFFVLGAIDYSLNNRFGIGEKFNEGIISAGRLLMCMAGFIILAPSLAYFVRPVVVPIFRGIGADPSLIAGILLANDSGGAVLAMALADSKEAGIFNGLIVGATLGTTLMFTFTVILMYTTEKERYSAFCGVMIGIITVPVACLAGGYVAGFSAKMIWLNTLPVLAISLILLLGLCLFREKTLYFINLFALFIRLGSLFGLVCGGIRYLTGIALIPYMSSLEDVFPIVGGIAVFLAGAFPMVAIIARLLKTSFARVCRVLKIKEESIVGLLLGLANGIAVFTYMHDMDDKGRLLVCAVMVSASCIVGDHLAYTAQTAPEYIWAVFVGKAAGGASALLLAIFLMPKIYKEQ